LKILLTGAAGFIGYHLARELCQRDFEILGVDNINDYYDKKLKLDRIKNLEPYNNFNFIESDISDKIQITEVFNKFEPEKVVNLAAQPGVRYSLINPDAYVNSNLQGFINIIELCRSKTVKGLIYASSSSVYGDNRSKPYSVNDRVNKPISLYGATKRANELIAFSYSHLYDINTTGLRYFTVYGPWYRPDMAMHIFAKKISNNEPIQVFNNGKMKRDFTYIDDIVKGTISAIEHNYRCEVFNLGNNKSEELMDVISLIEKYLNRSALVDFQPLQPGDAVETYADIDYSIEKLNYQPCTNIDTGILSFIDWFKEYYNV
tara:strand:+ start:1188 stop:2141 length:954 start_codon:yes stop_codon:yes gene_type:complete